MRDHLHRTTAQLGLPFGFTLTASGVLVTSIGRWPSPGLWQAWLFCAGAIIAHVVATLLVRIRFRPSDRQRTLLINVVPLAAVPIAVAGSQWIPDASAGFFVAGLLAGAAYIVGAAASIALGGWLHDRHRRDRMPAPPARGERGN